MSGAAARREAVAEVLRSAVVAAGRAVRAALPGADVVAKEGRGNFVTAADQASERILLAAISAAFPEDAILSEESRPHVPDPLAVPRLWVIDPLDGTSNFRHGRHYAAVSVALAERGVLEAAAVYDPFRDELFFAERGRGATRNGVPIRVGDRPDLASASVATDNSYDPQGTRRNLELCLRLDPTPWVLVRGSAVLSMCEVACGRTDVYYHTALQPWDNAAAFLLVREAGGCVTGFDGAPASFVTPQVVAGNADLVAGCLQCFGRG
jgi:myo-inositol-1(or 4)-monophosphatase